MQTKAYKEGYRAYHTNASDLNPYSYWQHAEDHTDWVDGFRDAAKEGPPRGDVEWRSEAEKDDQDDGNFRPIIDRLDTITIT